MYPFPLQPLPYAYDALEPYIAEEIMRLHHDRHLKTYVDQLNKALEPCPQLQCMSLEQLVVKAPSLPKRLAVPISRSGGGVYNHQFFFDGMQPAGEQRPEGALARGLRRCFGSVEEFQTQFTNAALGVFGSGYAWLVDCGGHLKIITTANQETPLTRGMRPILNLDVWEHAYYLQYYNMRADYVKAWWNVIDWAEAGRRYEAAPHGGCRAERESVKW